MQPKVKLLDQVRAVARAKHLSRRTEDAYVAYIRRFILFHNKQHPKEMGAGEITAFLTHLAVNDAVAASTQNQAFFALLFLYREILEVKLPRLEKFTPTRHSNHILSWNQNKEVARTCNLKKRKNYRKLQH